MMIKRRESEVDRGDSRKFMPTARMRAIRWEEAVLRSKCRRAGIVAPVVAHFTCGCGSVSCLGIPTLDPSVRQPRLRPKRV